MRTVTGWLPAENGEPETEVSAPVLGLMANPLTSPAWSAVYTKTPDGSTATELGPFPVDNEAPTTFVKEPLEVLTLYAEIELVELSAV
jgi:hypothetical protein